MRKRILAVLLGCVLAPFASAQLAVSANDGKVRLDNGVVKTVPNNPDTVAIIDLSARPPKLLHEIEVPPSIVGPPSSVAVAPDGSNALVTANMKLDPADPTKQLPDNRMSIIDLKANPPAVIGTVETGVWTQGIVFSADSKILPVQNKEQKEVQVLAIRGNKLVDTKQRIAMRNGGAGIGAR